MSGGKNTYYSQWTWPKWVVQFRLWKCSHNFEHPKSTPYYLSLPLILSVTHMFVATSGQDAAARLGVLPSNYQHGSESLKVGPDSLLAAICYRFPLPSKFKADQYQMSKDIGYPHMTNMVNRKQHTPSPIEPCFFWYAVWKVAYADAHIIKKNTYASACASFFLTAHGEASRLLLSPRNLAYA